MYDDDGPCKTIMYFAGEKKTERNEEKNKLVATGHMSGDCFAALPRSVVAHILALVWDVDDLELQVRAFAEQLCRQDPRRTEALLKCLGPARYYRGGGRLLTGCSPDEEEERLRVFEEDSGLNALVARQIDPEILGPTRWLTRLIIDIFSQRETGGKAVVSATPSYSSARAYFPALAFAGLTRCNGLHDVSLMIRIGGVCRKLHDIIHTSTELWMHKCSPLHWNSAILCTPTDAFLPQSILRRLSIRSSSKAEFIVGQERGAYKVYLSEILRISALDVVSAPWPALVDSMFWSRRRFIRFGPDVECLDMKWIVGSVFAVVTSLKGRRFFSIWNNERGVKKFIKNLRLEENVDHCSIVKSNSTAFALLSTKVSNSYFQGLYLVKISSSWDLSLYKIPANCRISFAADQKMSCIDDCTIRLYISNVRASFWIRVAEKELIFKESLLPKSTSIDVLDNVETFQSFYEKEFFLRIDFGFNRYDPNGPCLSRIEVTLLRESGEIKSLDGQVNHQPILRAQIVLLQVNLKFDKGENVMHVLLRQKELFSWATFTHSGSEWDVDLGGAGNLKSPGHVVACGMEADCNDSIIAVLPSSAVNVQYCSTRARSQDARAVVEEMTFELVSPVNDDEDDYNAASDQVPGADSWQALLDEIDLVKVFTICCVLAIIILALFGTTPSLVVLVLLVVGIVPFVMQRIFGNRG